MSGLLPPRLYKYLPRRYAERMVGHGEIMFSTLAWFQNYEDEQRGDRFEGTRKYFPVGGIDVTRTERDGQVHSPVSFRAATESLQSRASAYNHIFIYSTSLQNGLTFDGADACVEIYDPAHFAARLQSTLKSHPSAKVETLIHDEVKYYDFEAPPDNVWALPHLLAVQKHRAFSSQREVRIRCRLCKTAPSPSGKVGWLVRVIPSVPLQSDVSLGRTECTPSVHLSSLSSCARPASDSPSNLAIPLRITGSWFGNSITDLDAYGVRSIFNSRLSRVQAFRATIPMRLRS